MTTKLRRVPDPEMVEPRELPARWLSQAAQLERFAPAAAQAFREAAEELTAALESPVERVTLRQAHEIGGYSIDHLQRLVADGTIENVGAKNRPRIRRNDVPMKPGHHVLRVERGQRQLGASAVVTSAIERSSKR